MTPFADIAFALSGPRGSGRTHRMIQGAPENATVLVNNQQHAAWVDEMARKLGRADLKTLVPNDANMKGLRGSFIADHYTVERWLMEAEAEIRRLKRKLGEGDGETC